MKVKSRRSPDHGDIPRPPKISVAVASCYSEALLRNCLNSLCKNDLTNVEIIVAIAGDEIDSLKREYREVKFIELGKKATLPTLWANAISRSTGDIVAITDSSCTVTTTWINDIRGAHCGDSPVIGGAVEMTGANTLVNWAAYFCEYGQFMNPLSAGFAKVLPGNNISFKRQTLAGFDQFAKNEFWKTFLCQKLQAEGMALISDPSILVYCNKSYFLFPFLVRRFHHGRCFAGMRIQKSAIAKRIIFSLGTIFLPTLFAIRTSWPILQKRRHVREFILSFPISVLAILAWSTGEALGYLLGAGKSGEHIY